SARLSYSNTATDGIYPTDADSYERNTLSVALNSKVDFLTFGATANYVSTSGSAVATGQGLTVYNNLMQIPTDIDITEFRDYENDPFNTVSNYYTPYGVTNPYFTLNENGTDYKKERFYGSFDVSAKLNDWSRLTYRLGIDQYSEAIKIWQAIVDAEPGSPNDGTSTEVPGGYAEIGTNVKQINHDFLYGINLNPSESFNIQSDLGFNYNDRYSSSFAASVTTQDIPGYY